MLSSLVIIVTSSVLFLYWFRYTCLLLLAQRSNADYTLKVAATIRLSFPGIEAALSTDLQTPALESLYKCLDKDYRILTSLLRDTPHCKSIENRILMIDYKVMQLRFKLAGTGRNLYQARKALAEMSSILSYFAGEIGASATT